MHNTINVVVIVSIISSGTFPRPLFGNHTLIYIDASSFRLLIGCSSLQDFVGIHHIRGDSTVHSVRARGRAAAGARVHLVRDLAPRRECGRGQRGGGRAGGGAQLLRGDVEPQPRGHGGVARHPPAQPAHLLHPGDGAGHGALGMGEPVL